MTHPNLLKMVCDTTNTLLVAYDTEGRIILFNKACEMLSGYSLEDARSCPPWDYFLIPPEEIPAIKATLQDPGSTANEFSRRNHWITRSGERHLIEWNIRSVSDHAGRVEYVLATGMDITERNEVERALRQAQQQQRALLNGIPDLAWLKDAQGRYIATNRLFHARHDVSRTACRTVFDIFPPELAAILDSEDREIMQTGKPLHLERQRLVKGEVRWFDVRKSPILSETGEATGTVGISRDITERKLGDQLREQRETELRNTLVKEVHHRIKNTLQGLITLLHLHLGKEPALGPLIESMVSRLDAIATVHGLQSNADGKKLDLCSIVVAATSSLRALYGNESIALEFDDGFAATQLADSEIVPIALIINELITNAFKHGQAAQKMVHVRLQRVGPTVHITISNAHSTLPGDFDFAAGKGLGTGLRLVKSLLPPTGAEIRFEHTKNRGISAVISIAPPLISDHPHSDALKICRT